MTNTTHTPDTNNPDDLPRTFDRYANLSLADDTTVVYDREDPRRWIQSDVAIALPEVA